MQLGYSPRLSVIHTSSKRIGQVYVPAINWLLFCGTILLVLGFRHSGNLAAAYGVAVSATMVINHHTDPLCRSQVLGMGPCLDSLFCFHLFACGLGLFGV
jgi:K+ transporter